MNPHVIGVGVHHNHTAVAGRKTGRLATARHLLALTVIPLLLSVAACDGPPGGADRAMDQMAAMKIYTDPPPADAVLLAQGRDPGLASSITSRDPNVARVYAVSAAADAVVTHYKTTYPQYNWHTDYYFPPGATTGIELDGTSGWMRISVFVGAAPPRLDYPAITPSAAPADHPTYLTIFLAGLPH